MSLVPGTVYYRHMNKMENRVNRLLFRRYVYIGPAPQWGTRVLFSVYPIGFNKAKFTWYVIWPHKYYQVTPSVYYRLIDNLTVPDALKYEIYQYFYDR